jgi:hypothetical protein
MKYIDYYKSKGIDFSIQNPEEIEKLKLDEEINDVTFKQFLKGFCNRNFHSTSWKCCPVSFFQNLKSNICYYYLDKLSDRGILYVHVHQILLVDIVFWI